MHEVGLMQEALRIALGHAVAARAARVYSLTLRIGPLSGVENDALRFAFEVVTPGSAAEGAEVILEEVPIQCWCVGCARLFQPADYVFRCPDCQQISGDVRQGREFDLLAVEIS